MCSNQFLSKSKPYWPSWLLSYGFQDSAFSKCVLMPLCKWSSGLHKPFAKIQLFYFIHSEYLDIHRQYEEKIQTGNIHHATVILLLLLI